MSEQDFEQRLARRLRDHANDGLRPYDALEVARAAMWTGSRRAQAGTHRSSGMPAWFRSFALAAVLVVLLLATAVVGGLIKLPSPVVLPSPSATSGAEMSPSPVLSPSPTLSGEPSPSPGLSPTASPESPPPTAQPSPSPTASPIPTAPPTPPTGWREVSFPGNPRRIDLTAAAASNHGFVMVRVGGSGGRSWFSPDGVNWTRSTDTAFPGTPHVAAMGDQFYAIGRIGVWRSADGLNWTSLTTSPGLEFVWDVAVANGQLIAVGTNDDFDEARVWTSPDGISWSSIEPPAGASELTGVAARGGDIAVIGDDGSTGHGRRLHVLPAGGSGWQSFAPFGEDEDGRLVDFAANSGGFVAVGYHDDFDTGRRSGIAVASPDGASWTRSLVVDRDEGTLVFDQVVTLPDGRFMAVGAVRFFNVGECRPAGCIFLSEVATSYLSSDGISWLPGARIQIREEPVSEVGDQVEREREVAAGVAGVLLLDRWAGVQLVLFAPSETFR